MAKNNDWSSLKSDDKNKSSFWNIFVCLKKSQIKDSTHNNIHVYCNMILSEKFRLSITLNYCSKSSLRGRTVWNCAASQPERGTLISMYT